MAQDYTALMLPQSLGRDAAGGKASFKGENVKPFLLRVVTLLLLLAPAPLRAETSEPLLQRQEIAVVLEPDKHLVAGRSTLTYAPAPGKVVLRLADRAEVRSVQVSGKEVPFSFAAGVLQLKLPPLSGKGIVTVDYRAAFNDPVSRHPAASEDPSYGVNGAVTAEGTFLGGGAYWYPVPAEIPGKRSVTVTAPAGTEAVTAGRRLSRETKEGATRSVWEEEHPVGVLSLCAGPYRVEEKKAGEVTLYSYLYPANAGLSSRYLEAAAKYVSFYSDLFGPYPFEKFAVVENFFPTGYGFPSFTLLGGSVIRLPFIIDTSFPHEIAHSWWGNAIDVEPGEGNWAEGLVTYLADYLLKERRSAAEAKEYRRQLLIDYASLVTPDNDFPLSAFVSRSDPPSRAIGYGKGAMLFHMIRLRIGDRAFFSALKQVSRRQMYGYASWSDFIRAFSASSGKVVSELAKPWLTRTGGPRLALAEVDSRQSGKKWRVSGSILQNAPPYEMAVPVEVETAGGTVKENVELQGERTPFTIEVAAPPKRLLLDPEAQLFRILAAGEIPATVNSLKGATGLVGVITENCRAKAGTFKSFILSLSQEKAPLVREAELDPGARRDSDLVFCGVPRDRSLLPNLPEGVAVKDGVLSVEGEEFSGEDGLLLAVMRRGDAKGRVSALFHPLSEAAAVQYAPKITHYGKYSYLLFSAGANRRKGITPATGGGVVAHLGP